VLDSRHFANVRVDTPPVEPLDFRRRPGGADDFIHENFRWNVQATST